MFRNLDFGFSDQICGGELIHGDCSTQVPCSDTSIRLTDVQNYGTDITRIIICKFGIYRNIQEYAGIDRNVQEYTESFAAFRLDQFTSFISTTAPNGKSS